MEKSPSWEATIHSASKNFSTLYGTQSYITVFTARTDDDDDDDDDALLS
jgi:hypothetical protein